MVQQREQKVNELALFSFLLGAFAFICFPALFFRIVLASAKKRGPLVSRIRSFGLPESGSAVMRMRAVFFGFGFDLTANIQIQIRIWQ